MLPFKSMALHIAMRETHYDIYEYKYIEDLYYKLLFFWFSFLQKHKIDFVLFMVPPHHMGEYILYSLACVMKIKMLILYGVITNGKCVTGINNDSCGSDVSIEYEKYVANHISYDLDSLPQWLIHVYKRSTEATTLFSEKEIQKFRKDTWNIICSFLRPYDVFRRTIKFPLIPFMKKYHNNLSFHMKEQWRLLKLTVRAFFHELGMDHLNDYKKYSIHPDYSQKYIYFALQQTPEESTMPRAGEYKNQFLSIQTLSKAVEDLDNIKVYVKEHWVQPHRERNFYKSLAQLPNVSLVDFNVKTEDLIRNSIAVSSQTGTCLLEAALNCKNSFYFGAGMPYKGLPGSVFVEDDNQVKNELQEILKGQKKVTIDDGIRYLKALGEKTIPLYCDSLSETDEDYNKEQSAKLIVDVIARYYDQEKDK